MLVNFGQTKETHIEFVSYTGDYPSLCHGVLTLKINKEEVIFDSTCYLCEGNQGRYPSFWTSGGHCYQNREIGRTEQGEWEVDYQRIPNKYKKYAAEIDKVFNNNVPWGCCGGCL